MATRFQIGNISTVGASTLGPSNSNSTTGVANLIFGGLNAAVPEAVYDTGDTITEGEPTKLAMDYSTMIPILVKAIQELSAKNAALEASQASLMARLAALES